LVFEGRGRGGRLEVICWLRNVEHKVTVTGIDDKMAMGKDAMGTYMHGFSVTTLKMVAASCGM